LQRIVELSHHQRKPDPDVLLEICRDQGIDPEDTAYVGDSIARDIFMARTAGVLAIWAKYGASPTRRDYERLVRISHWTAADVARERELNEITHGIEPDVVLSHDFAEIVRPLISASTS
jgi:phosphoglycolate phosphatase